jgi:hypothetical protein
MNPFTKTSGSPGMDLAERLKQSIQSAQEDPREAYEARQRARKEMEEDIKLNQLATEQQQMTMLQQQQEQQAQMEQQEQRAQQQEQAQQNQEQQNQVRQRNDDARALTTAAKTPVTSDSNFVMQKSANKTRSLAKKLIRGLSGTTNKARHVAKSPWTSGVGLSAVSDFGAYGWEDPENYLSNLASAGPGGEDPNYGRVLGNIFNIWLGHKVNRGVRKGNKTVADSRRKLTEIEDALKTPELTAAKRNRLTKQKSEALQDISRGDASVMLNLAAAPLGATAERTVTAAGAEGPAAVKNIAENIALKRQISQKKLDAFDQPKSEQTTTPMEINVKTEGPTTQPNQTNADNSWKWIAGAGLGLAAIPALAYAYKNLKKPDPKEEEEEEEKKRNRNPDRVALEIPSHKISDKLYNRLGREILFEDADEQGRKNMQKRSRAGNTMPQGEVEKRLTLPAQQQHFRDMNKPRSNWMDTAFDMAAHVAPVLFGVNLGKLNQRWTQHLKPQTSRGVSQFAQNAFTRGAKNYSNPAPKEDWSPGGVLSVTPGRTY